MIDQCGEFAIVAALAAGVGALAGLVAYIVITRTGGSTRLCRPDSLSNAT